jgi:hypothetical protein
VRSILFGGYGFIMNGNWPGLRQYFDLTEFNLTAN